MTQCCDFLIVGGGIAGATAAYHLSQHGKVVVLERETTAGYHTTGRSAAQYFETYGGPDVIRLNQASRAFFDQPPEGFSESPLLTERDAMLIARADQLDTLEQHRVKSVEAGANVFHIDAAEALARVPFLRPEYVAGALSEPDSRHMDVDAIHQGYLRGARRQGAKVVVDAEVESIERVAQAWRIESRAGTFEAPCLINAAGAWCDEVAALAGVTAIGLVPKRRTVILIEAPVDADISGWPMTIDIDELFYFKPDAGQLLASPADETPMPPCDAAPDELDIAVLVDRLEQATTLPIRRIAHRWAGLRSFVADQSLVIGEEPDAPGFFWLAGQGGYGIQTSPAAGRAIEALVLGRALPNDMVKLGLTPAALGPSRLRA